jgi:hypothetical protein
VRILFDQGTPVPLRRALKPHVTETAFERGWATLTNGELLVAAERAGFDVLVTTDLRLKYQQNLASRRMAIVVLTTPSWPRIRRHLAEVSARILGAIEGAYDEVVVP